MKLGYLFVPPSGSWAHAPKAPEAGRAQLARSLGFSEFYVPTTGAAARVRALPGPEAHPLLQILSGSHSVAGPQLAYTDQAINRGLAPGRTRLAAPQACEHALLEQSRSGLLPFSTSWVSTDQLSRHWAAHVTGSTYAARKSCPEDWRIARTVLVDDDAARAEAMVKSPDSPCRAYYASLLAPDADDATIETLIDACVLYGDGPSVAHQLDCIRQATAAFGTLVLVDHAWADAARARRSMALFAEMVHESLGSAPEPAPRLEWA